MRRIQGARSTLLLFLFGAFFGCSEENLRRGDQVPEVLARGGSGAPVSIVWTLSAGSTESCRAVAPVVRQLRRTFSPDEVDLRVLIVGPERELVERLLLTERIRVPRRHATVSEYVREVGETLPALYLIDGMVVEGVLHKRALITEMRTGADSLMSQVRTLLQNRARLEGRERPSRESLTVAEGNG